MTDKAKEIQFQELRREREEEVRLALEAWPQSKLCIAYQYLHALGIKIASIDYQIEKALRLEVER